jgi:hypothetical protein
MACGGVEVGSCLEEFVLAAIGRLLRFREQGSESRVVERLERLDCGECLVEEFPGVDSGDLNRDGQAERVMEAFDGGDNAILQEIALEENAASEALHAENCDVLTESLWRNKLSKATEVRVEDVDRHLDRIKMEPVMLCDLQHVEVNMGIFVACEADESHLSCSLGFEDGFHGATLVENAVGIIESNYFVVLKEIDAINLEPFQ